MAHTLLTAYCAVHRELFQLGYENLASEREGGNQGDREAVRKRLALLSGGMDNAEYRSPGGDNNSSEQKTGNQLRVVPASVNSIPPLDNLDQFAQSMNSGRSIVLRTLRRSRSSEAEVFQKTSANPKKASDEAAAAGYRNDLGYMHMELDTVRAHRDALLQELEERDDEFGRHE